MERRSIERKTQEAEASQSLDPTDLERTICACIDDLIPTLKPGYSDLLFKVDLEGVAVLVAAEQLGITANNAGVRLHRARQALKDRLVQSCGTCTIHGCLDCTCKSC